MQMKKQTFHIVFKTHLDVGFTDFGRNVEKQYLEEFVPRAMDLADELNEPGTRKKFVWTLGSWIIHRCLEAYRGKSLKRLEAALAGGDICWHALPFTTHSELLTPSLFKFGLLFSQELDARFGRRTRAAKFTDVPGHTIGIVPLLTNAGVRFLHIGSNPGSTPPDVPGLFEWREPESGASITVMYQPGGYGKLFHRKDCAAGLLVAFTEDNLGTPSKAEIETAFRVVDKKYPNVDVKASSLDGFFDEFEHSRLNIPIVEKELGDTWIHGAGSAPGKVRRFRELCRLRDEWIEAGVAPNRRREFFSFSENLLLVGEHTWALDVKSHLGDDEAYSHNDFKKARRRKSFRKMEASWAEQEAYIDSASDALEGTAWGRKAVRRIAESEPYKPDISGYEKIATERLVFETEHFRAGFDLGTGTIDSLVVSNKKANLAGENNTLGAFTYYYYGADDYERFFKQYGYRNANRMDWFPRDFGKPGLEKTLSRGGRYGARLKRAYIRKERTCPADPVELLFEMCAPVDAPAPFGFPARLFMLWKLHHLAPRIELEVIWSGKPACRIPESMWIGFAPRRIDPGSVRIEKTGRWLSPLDVVRNGNRKLHATNRGVALVTCGIEMLIESIDAPLVAPGAPSLLDFNNRRPPLKRGVHFNLFNNVWGTNFPQWTSEDARFRFAVEFRS